jgi:predicted ATP-binding protein involved in virulence
VNGAGKSTLISAIHLMFQRYISAMRIRRTVGRGPMLRELRKGTDSVHLAVVAENEGTDFSWWIDRTFKGLHSRKTNEDLESFRHFIREQLKSLETPDTANVPLLTTYPVSRSVVDILLRIRSKDATTQAAAFQVTALSTSRTFRSFFSWYRDREDYENERRVETRSFRDPQLSAVRIAIERLMPGFSDLPVKRRPLRMIISKGGAEFEVDSLSDGEKGLLALVGDLARRLSLCNPGLKEPLNGQGIVLIDELELHLHPAWQRNAVHGLLEAFPNIQFIFTTHSPQVLSELRAQQIFLLRDGIGYSAARSYGMESAQILRELMGDPGRPTAVEDEISALYDRLDSGDLDEDERHLRQFEATVGEDDPALLVARAKVRRSKVLRNREAHH